MSGGVVGGLSSVAMGGDFWQGFTQGAASAGLSFAANEIAGEIKNASVRGAVSGGEQPAKDGGVPVPTNQVKAGDRVAVAYTEYDISETKVNAQGTPVTTKDAIAANAQKLANDLSTKNHAQVGPPMKFASWEAFRNWYNSLPANSYEHVYFLAHNFSGTIPFSADRYTSAMAPGGERALSAGRISSGGSFVWAACGSGQFGHAGYLLDQPLASHVWGSADMVTFGYTHSPATPTIGTGISSRMWTEVVQ
jgi:hypothetical protein